MTRAKAEPRRLALLLGAAALAAGAMAWAARSATGSVQPGARPQRIMSINMCTDLILLQLVPRKRIASVTYLAHDGVEALMPGRDKGIATNRGTAEDVLLQRPDLILASPWTGATVRRLAEKVGAPIVAVEDANDFAAIRRAVRTVAKAVGEAARGERLIARMDAELAALAENRPARPLRVISWSGDGSVPGKGTLTDAIVTAAGGINLGAERAGKGYASLGLEELLALRPDAIMQGSGSWDQPSLRRMRARHPLVERLYAGRQIDYPDAGYTCGLPQSAAAATRLAVAFATVPRAETRW